MDLVLDYLNHAVSVGHLQWQAGMPKIMQLFDKVKELIDSAPKPGSGSPAKGKKQKKTLSSVAKPKSGDESDTDDKDYVPPCKRPAGEVNSEPERIFDSDGNEMTEKTDLCEELDKKRAERHSMSTKNSIIAAAKPSKARTSASKVTIELASEDKLDAKPVKDKEDWKHWEFICRYCKCIRTFPRTLSKTKDHVPEFDNEPQIPKLNNLATHIGKCKAKKHHDEAKEVKEARASLPSTVEFNYRHSAEFMAKFLEKGHLNPVVKVTPDGFQCIFAA
ncbi:hypothetical protein H1R20_g16124, partial [Candolleomyces eurysporus]